MPESALKRTIDFTGVGESRQPSAHVPAGDYLLEVESIEIKPSTNGPWENANWQFSIVGQPGAGVIYENTTLKKEGLFRLRDLIVAMGMKSPTSKIGLDFSKFIGKQVGATLVDNEFEKLNERTQTTEKRTTSKVGTFFPASRLAPAGVLTGTSPAPITANVSTSNGHAPAAQAEEAEVVADEEAVEELEFVDEAI